jgi:hypothetical protein
MSSISRILADDPELTDGLTGERLNAAVRECVAGTDWLLPGEPPAEFDDLGSLTIAGAA